MDATEGATEFERKALARIAAWHAKADDLMRCAKAYHCRSQEAVRTGYIKQAAQARMCAEELERDYAESTQAVAEEPIVPETIDGPQGSEASGADQAEGSVDVPEVRADHDAAGSGPQGSDQPRRKRGRRQPAMPMQRPDGLPRGEEPD